MPEEKSKNMNSQDGVVEGDMSYILFLILILLFLGNSNTFSAYFNIFEKEVDKASKIFEALTATAEGLKSAVQTPQEVMQDLGLNL